jgi:hypothetical protein
MGAALSLFVLMSLSIFIVRVASVALRQTGLEESSARFQALSAISGTGFTTKEAESVVNYPVRRRIVMLLMVIGNLGVVTVMATVVVSFVNTQGDTGAVFIQLAWLVGVLGLLWFLILNKRAEQWMCDLIGRFLQAKTFLGARHFTRLLQLGDGYSVCVHPVASAWLEDEQALTYAQLGEKRLTVLAVRLTDGDLVQEFHTTTELNHGDALVLYGADEGHDALETLSVKSETAADHLAHRHAKHVDP